jgi:hypothetical protein
VAGLLVAALAAWSAGRRNAPVTTITTDTTIRKRH